MHVTQRWKHLVSFWNGNLLSLLSMTRDYIVPQTNEGGCTAVDGFESISFVFEFLLETAFVEVWVSLLPRH